MTKNNLTWDNETGMYQLPEFTVSAPALKYNFTRRLSGTPFRFMTTGDISSDKDKQELTELRAKLSPTKMTDGGTADKNGKNGKQSDSEKTVKFDGLDYSGSRFINTDGDTISVFGTVAARPGQLYEIRYTNKKNGDGNSILTTRLESGQMLAGRRNRISRTSDWGKTIDNSFYEASQSLPITEDFSKKPFIPRMLYKLFGLKQGGLLMRNGGKIIEVPFN